MNKIFKYLQSSKLTVILLVIYGVVMGVATFYEKNTSTAEVFQYVYHSGWFFIIQFLMAVNFIAVSIKRKLFSQRKWGVLLLHYSFVTILCGAMYTHLFSYEGMMHIREGESSSILYIGDGNHAIEQELPFSVELEDFILKRYPGSSSPSSYESDVVIRYKGEVWRQKIYMNNIAYVGPFRIYQTSYDRDELGTILTVNRDLIGMIMSYLGYFMMTIGFIFTLLDKKSRYRTLIRRLKELSAQSNGVKIVVIAALFSLMSSTVIAQPRYVPLETIERELISNEVADSIASLLVQNPNGRTEPFNSYASKMLRKIYRSDSYNGISAEKVLVGFFSNPYLWASTPIIYIGKDHELQKILGVTDRYVSYNDLFNVDNGSYKISSHLQKIYSKEVKSQNKFEKDILKVDEKINIMNALFSMQLLNIYPLEGSEGDKWFSAGDDTSLFSGMDSMMVTKSLPLFIQSNEEALQNGDWSSSLELISHLKTYQRVKASEEHLISHKRVEAEIFYNKVNIFKVSGLSYLILGAVLLFVMLLATLRGSLKYGDKIFYALFALICSVFIYHSFGIGLRWYISGRAPWTNSYETMVYVGWSAVLAGVIFARRSRIAFGVSTLMGGIILMISMLSFLDPEITPLVPVLKSYWLMFHVAIITASYGFFFISALLALFVLVTMIVSKRDQSRQIEELNIINELSITIGLALLSIGVFLGAVWANESWGRYWGWDPKETWALISMIVYAFVLHARAFKPLRSRYAFAVMSLVSIYAILMTFFGVNYYLSGMHSYGSSEGFNSAALIGATFGVLVICVLAYLKEKRR